MHRNAGVGFTVKVTFDTTHADMPPDHIPLVYRTVAIDCPWPETGGGQCKRGADRHYPVLKIRDIPRVILLGNPYFKSVGNNAHCYMWATNNHLQACFWVMGQIGFRYVTCVTWVKPRFGLGQYFRGQTEHLMFGVRGQGYETLKPQPERVTFRTLIRAKPSKRHSEKPHKAYRMIEARSLGPYLELFARDPRKGWTTWGNEV